MITVMRTLVRALMASVVVIVVAMSFVLLPADGATDAPPVWAWAIPVVLAVGSYLLTGAVGFRTPPLPAQTTADDARSRSGVAYQSLLILRFALSEAVVMVSIAVGFVLPSGGYLVFLLGAVLGLVLLRLRVWPDEASIVRTERALELDGARSYLREALGVEPANPVQRL